MDKQIEIVDDFLSKYFKSPSEEEFVKLGGNLNKVKRICGSYRKFLDDYGYDQPTRGKPVQVFDTRGRLVYEGMTSDIAEKFNKDITYVRKACTRGHLFCREYILKYKEVKYED